MFFLENVLCSMPQAQGPKGPETHRSLLFFGGICSREGDCLWGPEMLEAQQGPGSNTYLASPKKDGRWSNLSRTVANCIEFRWGFLSNRI
jgi:hypothetical protein